MRRALAEYPLSIPAHLAQSLTERGRPVSSQDGLELHVPQRVNSCGSHGMVGDMAGGLAEVNAILNSGHSGVWRVV